MAALTDTGIRAELRTVERTGKAKSLKDGAGRGTGRLLLMIRPRAAGVPLAEWYAAAWRDGRRQTRKLGTFPALSLRDARRRFESEAAPKIEARQSIRRSAKAGTLEELLRGYCTHLEGRRSHYQAAYLLLNAPDCALTWMGGSQPANSVTVDDCREWLADLYKRGPTRAKEARGWLAAAYAWAMKAETGYTAPAGPVRFALTVNPARSVAPDPAAKRPGTRYLSPAEVQSLWKWTHTTERGFDRRYLAALRVMLLTGQRVEEVLALSRTHLDTVPGFICWPTTKTGRPHRIPLTPATAAELDAIGTNKHGLFFPGHAYPDRPLGHVPLWKVASAWPGAHFAPRDLRRTWATLAADFAGVSWEARERVQNHALPGMGERHYSPGAAHADLMREALLKWEAWLAETVAG
jgi:integrase